MRLQSSRRRKLNLGGESISWLSNDIDATCFDLYAAIQMPIQSGSRNRNVCDSRCVMWGSAFLAHAPLAMNIVQPGACRMQRTLSKAVIKTVHDFHKPVPPCPLDAITPQIQFALNQVVGAQIQQHDTCFDQVKPWLVNLVQPSHRSMDDQRRVCTRAAQGHNGTPVVLGARPIG